jgi:hypothetical protein
VVPVNVHINALKWPGTVPRETNDKSPVENEQLYALTEKMSATKIVM